MDSNLAKSFSVENVDEYEAGMLAGFAWCVLKEIKPACEMMARSEEEVSNVIERVKYLYPELKTTVKIGFSKHHYIVFFYKYDHVKRLIDEAYRVRDTDTKMYHVLLGYAFGIPAHEIERFLNKD